MLESLDMTMFLGSRMSLSSPLFMLMNTGLRTLGELARDLSKLRGDNTVRESLTLLSSNFLLRDFGVLVECDSSEALLSV